MLVELTYQEIVALRECSGFFLSKARPYLEGDKTQNLFETVHAKMVLKANECVAAAQKSRRTSPL